MHFTALPSGMPGPLEAVICDPASTATTSGGVAAPTSAMDHTPPSASASIEDAVMEDLERAVRQDVHEVTLAENTDLSQEQTLPATSELDTDRIRETRQNQESGKGLFQVKQEDPEGSLFVKDEPEYIVIDDSDRSDTDNQQADELSDDADMDTIDENGSEYDPADHSDSDAEEPSAHDGKLQPSVSGEDVSQKLEELKLQRMKLNTKSEYVPLDDEEKQMLRNIEEGLAKLQASLSENADADPKTANAKSTPKKKRRKHIKNVREYFARKYEEEDEKDAEREEKKRKQEVQSGGPKKKRTTPKQYLHGAAERKTIKMRGRIFHGLNDVEEDIAQGSIPTMASFQASTKKDQWQQLKRSIPEGSDLRRVNTQSKDLDEATKMFGRGKIKAKDSTWLMDGMNWPLLDYQLAAVGWMMSRECGRSGPSGGILADAPGLGKTVISLASIIGKPPRGPEDDEFCQATLIGVPNRDIAIQWKDEVKKHCKKEYADSVIIWSQSLDISMATLKKQWIM
jgi:SNF2 family DNA or RNA helicase